jgi:hypothetical protein
MTFSQGFLRREAAAAIQDAAHHLSLAERSLSSHFNDLVARVNIKSNATSDPGLIEANTVDPFKKSGKYALAWVYFGVILLVITFTLYFYHAVTDRIRTAQHEDELLQNSATSSPATDYEMTALKTDKSTSRFFPRDDGMGVEAQNTPVEDFWTFRPVLVGIALFRYVFYRPAPEYRIKKGWRPITLPSFSTLTIALLGVTMSILYCFIQQPLLWKSMAFGSPPLSVRSGMMAVSLMPWIIAMAMKANVVSLLTGIGHERLNVLHRWGAYLCLMLSIIHAVPFYIQKAQDPAGYAVYQTYFQTNGLYIFGTGKFHPLVKTAKHF